MTIHDLAHGRSGDKGNHANVAVIAYTPAGFEWLREHYPDRADHVLSLLRQLRGGALYESGFGSRQRGFGPFAALLKARFEKARRRLRLEREVELSTDKFVPPRPSRRQLDLGF